MPRCGDVRNEGWLLFDGESHDRAKRFVNQLALVNTAHFPGSRHDEATDTSPEIRLDLDSSPAYAFVLGDQDPITLAD